MQPGITMMQGDAIMDLVDPAKTLIIREIVQRIRSAQVYRV